jgi:hypothetical protein
MLQIYFVIIIIIIIIIRYECLLSQAFSSWYFSWASGDPPPLRLQASHCSISRIVCDVPSLAVLLLLLLLLLCFIFCVVDAMLEVVWWSCYLKAE